MKQLLDTTLGDLTAERVRRSHQEAIRELQHLVRKHVTPEAGLSLAGLGDDIKDIGTDTDLVNDHKVLVDAADATPGYLDDKISTSQGVGHISSGGVYQIVLTNLGHELAGEEHRASTLAELNAKISDANVDADTASRPPDDHALGGSAHTATTLAELNALISDADLDDDGDTRPPAIHELGGAAHSITTLAELNALISDATLDDDGDARPPETHTLGGSKHLSSSLSSLNGKISDADVAAWTTGTWTPTFIVGTGGSVGTYALQDGIYRRIGDWVHVWCVLAADVDSHITFGGGVADGPIQIGGLPFDALEETWFAGVVQPGNNLRAATTTKDIFAFIIPTSPATDKITLSHDGVDVVDGSDGAWDFDNSATVVISLDYIAAP